MNYLKDERGLTLLEMLGVIVLIGLITLFGIVMYTQSSNKMDWRTLDNSLTSLNQHLNKEISRLESSVFLELTPASVTVYSNPKDYEVNKTYTSKDEFQESRKILLPTRLNCEVAPSHVDGELVLAEDGKTTVYTCKRGSKEKTITFENNRFVAEES